MKKHRIGFDGRVAIVTGAGGGLGRSHALALAERGAKVLVNDYGGAVNGSGLSSSSAQHVVDEINALGGIAAANHESVATSDGGNAIVQDALNHFGRVDIVINNAGILRDKAFHKMDSAMIDAVIDVHLKGSLYVSQPAFSLMRQQGYGRIVNTTSASGLFGNFGQANYGAAKAGLLGLTRVLAIEGSTHNVLVNAIAPIASTRMNEGMRARAVASHAWTGGDQSMLGDLVLKASADSVSPMVVYLASEQCAVSGNVYSVAGGRIARIAVVESPGEILDDNTPEAISDNLASINGSAIASFVEPRSLDDEAEIIVRSLARGL